MCQLPLIGRYTRKHRDNRHFRPVLPAHGNVSSYTKAACCRFGSKKRQGVATFKMHRILHVHIKKKGGPPTVDASWGSRANCLVPTQSRGGGLSV